MSSLCLASFVYFIINEVINLKLNKGYVFQLGESYKFAHFAQFEFILS